MNLENLLEKVKKVDWQYLVSRKEALLHQSFVANCYQFFKKATGINWQATMEFRPGDLILYSAKELGDLRSLFVKGGVQLFKSFRKRLIFYMKALDKVANSVAKTDCSKLKKSELTKLLTKFSQQDLYAYNFLLPMPIADGVISKMILDSLPQAPDQEKQSWLGALAYPAKENEHTKEERSFYKIAKVYKTNPQKAKRLIKAHLKKYAWIGARGYWWWRVWIEKDIRDRLDNFFAQKQDPDKELENLDNIRKERTAATKELLKKFNIKKNSPLHQLILLAKEYAYLRTWRTDIIYGSGYRARGLFKEAVKRAGLDGDDAPYFTFMEIAKMAKTGQPAVSQEEINKRKEFYGTVFMNGQYTVLSGQEWQKKLQEIVDALGIQKPAEAVQEIKGNVAFQGAARGVAKLVFTGDDIKKVNRGDILVAVMTFPHFVPAMEKAVAFVTDEGGILSHAAIVSREMKKPCVIATKIATKVLKDGDLVEVDANNGVVKILRKAK